jgi:tRNA G18 (ribose-2'-O)-methylase SpoU
MLAEITGVDVHRGVLASADRPAPSDPIGLLAAHQRVAVLEGLTDLENVGAVFRVAAALGIGAVLLDDRCADPLYRRCVRVSLGWSTVVPHARIGSLPEGLDVVDAAGHRSVALTPRGGSMAVEGPGLSGAAIGAAQQRVAIPMAEGVDSLNAATALAVVASFAAANRGWDG